MKKFIDPILGIAGLIYLAWLFDIDVAFRSRVYDMTGEQLFGIGLLLVYMAVWTLTTIKPKTEPMA